MIFKEIKQKITYWRVNSIISTTKTEKYKFDFKIKMKNWPPKNRKREENVFQWNTKNSNSVFTFM